MRALGITGLLVLLSTAFAQDLPPEVILLARIKAHMRDEISRLPNYTCLATINRYHKPNASAAMKPLDTVRLEVIYGDHHEWYGAPGDRTLGVSNPSSFVGSGLMGSGTFGITLHNIINGAHFVYHGKETGNGRSVAQYDFVFPRQTNAFEISMPGGRGEVGEKGSMWVDEKSYELIRLETHADDIPAYLPLAEQSLIVSYARTQIGDGSALLAQQADVRLVETGGVDNFDHFEFSNCRSYSAESVISFGGTEIEGGQTARPSSLPASPQAFVIPALLRVTVRLMSAVSSGDPVGKLIEGRVSGNVSSKGKILLHDGDLVRGRIRRLEHYQGKEDGDWIVGLEFTEVETAAGHAPFYADLLGMDKNPMIVPKPSERVSAGKVEITIPELPGVASFFVRSANFSIPAGFGMEWRTRGPIRGQY